MKARTSRFFRVNQRRKRIGERAESLGKSETC